MKTPPPETKVQSETLEQIAHKIVKRYLDDYINDHQLEQQIISALRNERERVAQLCDKEAAEWAVTARNYSALDPMRNSCLSRAEMAEELAKAIREGR